MCSTAAHLTDRVFPDVPIRQWVLSVPFELRLLLAKNAAALSAVGRIFVREIWRWQREQFRASFLSGPSTETSRPPTVRGGAVCFPQRFGGSLNLNVHYHVAVPDGVFGRRKGEGVVFHQLAMPNRSDPVLALAWTIGRACLNTHTASERSREPRTLGANDRRVVVGTGARDFRTT
jgi:hypothetical protein